MGIRMQHYFVSDVLRVGKVVSLPDNVSHHLSRVLRTQVGDSFELVDQNQQVFQAAISQIDGRVVTATITAALDRNVELPVETTIVSGLSKANKPELIVQKSTELGVNRVIFLPMNRSIVKWDQKAAKKLTRLNEVALSAAEQSHRNQVPKVDYLSGLTALNQLSFDTKIVAYEESAKIGEEANLVKAVRATKPGQSIVAVFGPEGGIDEGEVNLLVNNGYRLAGLGPRIMRTETAPLYFLSAVSVLTELLS